LMFSVQNLLDEDYESHWCKKDRFRSVLYKRLEITNKKKTIFFAQNSFEVKIFYKPNRL